MRGFALKREHLFQRDRVLRFGVEELGFRIQNPRFTFWESRSGVQGLCPWVWGWDSGFMIRVQGSGFTVWESRFGVQG